MSRKGAGCSCGGGLAVGGVALGGCVGRGGRGADIVVPRYFERSRRRMCCGFV